MELVPGCGTNLVLFFLLLVGCVVAETHGYGSSDPAHARPGNSCGGTAGSRVVEWSEWDCPMLDEADYIDWTGGGCSCSRDVGEMDWQQVGMAQLELRDESLRGRRQAVVRKRDECREQYGRGDQCTASRCAVVFCLGHGVHEKTQGSHRKCSTRWKYEGVPTSLSGVFSEERCKVDMTVVLAVLSDTKEVVAGAVWESALEGASESSGGSSESEIVCWYYERQRTSECRKMQRDPTTCDSRRVRG